MRMSEDMSEAQLFMCFITNSVYLIDLSEQQIPFCANQKGKVPRKQALIKFLPFVGFRCTPCPIVGPPLGVMVGFG